MNWSVVRPPCMNFPSGCYCLHDKDKTAYSIRDIASGPIIWVPRICFEAGSTMTFTKPCV